MIITLRFLTSVCFIAPFFSRGRKNNRLFLSLVAYLGLNGIEASSATLLTGFSEETIGGTWNQAVGLTFASDGRMFVWEKAGRVWIVENGMKLPQPLIDIADEVGNWGDHGPAGIRARPKLSRQRLHLFVLRSGSPPSDQLRYSLPPTIKRNETNRG